MSEFASKRSWGPTPKYDRAREYVRLKGGLIAIAGPCSVESKEQIELIAESVARSGATHLRGGLFRAGTYPGDNFGPVSTDLFEAFARAGRSRGLKTIIEVLDYSPTQIQFVSDYADCFQIGCRQMQNYTLLKKVAEYGKQTFLKRHPGTTLDEWLGAAEYLLKACPICEPVLIERGSVSHVNHVRWDLSISMIPAIKALTNIPIVVDASHGTGRRDLVEPMTLAGIAAGADGCLVEVHDQPAQSLSDADQAINPAAYDRIMKRVHSVRRAIAE